MDKNVHPVTVLLSYKKLIYDLFTLKRDHGHMSAEHYASQLIRREIGGSIQHHPGRKQRVDPIIVGPKNLRAWRERNTK